MDKQKTELRILILKFISTAIQFVISVLILAIIIVFMCSYAHAESAVVSFNDAEHLAAISDSITNVCDTVGGYWVHKDTVYNFKIYVAEIGEDIELDYVYVDGDSTSKYPYWVGRTITCRELVSRTVVEHYYHGITRWLIANGDTIWVDATGRGTAIITWEEVKP